MKIDGNIIKNKRAAQGYKQSIQRDLPILFLLNIQEDLVQKSKCG